MKEKLFSLFLFVMAAWAYRFRKCSNDQSLGVLEQEARMAWRGIWSHENPVPPWEFRKAKNSTQVWYILRSCPSEFCTPSMLLRIFPS